MLLITSQNIGRHGELVESMHVDRKRVFVDWLEWEIEHDGRCERDEFDDAEAEYLVLACRSTGRHLASVRLLRTDRPHILGDVFAHCCDGDVPRSASIREITRLCVSPDCPKELRLQSRRRLLSGLAEYGLMSGLVGYTLLTDMAFLSRVAAVGWRCEMLGMPTRHGDGTIGALMVHLDHDTIPSLRRSGVYEEQLAMRHARVAA